MGRDTAIWALSLVSPARLWRLCYKNVNTIIPCRETRKESFRTSLYLIYLDMYQSDCLGTRSKIIKNSFILTELKQWLEGQLQLHAQKWMDFVLWLSFGETPSLRVGSRWLVTGPDEFWMSRKEKNSQPVWVAVVMFEHHGKIFSSALETDISFVAGYAHCLLCFLRYLQEVSVPIFFLLSHCVNVSFLFFSSSFICRIFLLVKKDLILSLS